MIRNIKKFWNLEFKIEECEDEVFESDSDEQSQIEEIESDENDKAEENKKFTKTFIFSCLGIGLTNFARKAE